MKSTAVILAIATLFASTEACSCLSGSGVNEAASNNCCGPAGGTWTGSDCPASEISENLSNYAKCCASYGDRSDCRCPVGCAAEIEALHRTKGATPVTDDEIMAIVAKYN